MGIGGRSDKGGNWRRERIMVEVEEGVVRVGGGGGRGYGWEVEEGVIRVGGGGGRGLRV